MKLARAQKPIEIAPGRRFVKRKVRAGLVALLAAGLLCLPFPGAAQPTFDYSAYARVLEEYVTPADTVRYAALQKDPSDLKAFIRQLAAVSPRNRPGLFPTADHRMAYWINAYNALVLNAVVEDYPIDSVVRLGTLWGALFFKRARHVAGGKEYSLDDIEHGILRGEYNDARIHFALNCASSSCPVLPREPYRGEMLDAQLDRQARAFIGKKQNLRLRGDVLFLNAIFDWYKEDFLQAVRQQGVEDPTLIDYVAQYLPEETVREIRQKDPRIEFTDYDWALNEARAD